MTLKSLDLFKKLPTDHFPQTAIGGCFSLLAFVTMGVLFALELQAFLTPQVVTETLVDTAREDWLQVNINVTLPHVPCGMLSMDLQDATGGHKSDITGSFRKIQLDKWGAVLANQELDGSLNAIRGALSRGENCRLEGDLQVASVPGNFHISFHNQHGLVHQLMLAELKRMRLDHTLTHFSFGRDVSAVMEQPLLSPYDNQTVVFPADNFIYNQDYYIKISPVLIVDEESGTQHNSYQFSMNKQFSQTNSIFGAIYFRYDIDSVTVKYTKKRRDTTHFLISCCAILGGVFAVIGMAHSATQHVIRAAKGA